jgi:SAM-dependent methyltransferase
MSERPETPARYTHGHHESVLRSHSWRTVENSAAYLEPHLVPGISVLDVGSGPGTITVDMAGRVAPGRVIGIDAAAGIVEQATSLAVEAGLHNVHFETADLFALPFDDDAFVWAPENPGLDRWMDVYQAVHRGNGGEPDAGRRLKGWALEAGFVEVASSASVWCFASDEDRTWWGDSWAARATESAFYADAIEKGAATHDELHAIADAWRTWRDAPDGWLIMPHGELLARA